jgi:hypothetical protein
VGGEFADANVAVVVAERCQAADAGEVVASPPNAAAPTTERAPRRHHRH